MKIQNIPQFVRDGNYEVNMSPHYLIERIKEWQAEDGLQINPDFQRGHIWTEQQQINWIEYYLRGGKSGMVLYFNAPWWGHFNKGVKYNDFVLVDGLQRLTAFTRFTNNEIQIFGSSYLHDFEDGKLAMSRFGRLRININTLQTKREVLTWYLQMNDGGTPHTQDEINKVKLLLEKED